MDNLPSANRALLSYICSLLSDGVAITAESNSGILPNENRGSGELNDDSYSNISSEQDNLRVLFIKAAGIPLAIPLDDIKEIVDAEGRSLSYSESVKGEIIALLNHGGRDIRVLHLREIILPDGHPTSIGINELNNTHILISESGVCGLVCDEVMDIIKLNRQEVEWRARRHSRPWLQGMVKGYNHALLDVKEIVKTFKLSSEIPH
jgi:chemotaxis signal transduction protein